MSLKLDKINTNKISELPLGIPLEIFEQGNGSAWMIFNKVNNNYEATLVDLDFTTIVDENEIVNWLTPTNLSDLDTQFQIVNALKEEGAL
jgi:hypothetical protein